MDRFSPLHAARCTLHALVLATSATLLTTAALAAGPGTTGSNFLRVPLDARAAALGGAATAVSADPVALDYNPAGLAGLARRAVKLSYVSFIENTSLQGAAYAGPIAPSGPTARRPLFGGVQYRGFSADDEARSITGAKLGEFGIRDQLFQAGAAIQFSPRLAFGASGKIISRKIEDESATNFAGDAGVLWRPADRLAVGASLLHLGPAKAFISEKDPLPLTLRAGAAFRTKRFLFLADVAAGRDEVVQPAVGVEWAPLPLLVIRAGGLHNSNFQASGGIGIRLSPGAERDPFETVLGAPRSDVVSKPTLAEKTKVREQVIASTLYQLAESLTQQYEYESLPIRSPRLAVFPIRPGTPLTSEFSRTLTRKFAQIDQFKMADAAEMEKALASLGVPADRPLELSDALKAADVLETDLIVLSSIESDARTHTIVARMIEVENREIIGTARRTLDRGALEDGRSQRNLAGGMAPTSGATFMLDYAVQTRDEFDVSHMVTFKVYF